MHFSKHILPLLATLLCLALLPACSTKKNTAGTRFWQQFTTRYNVYYNGAEAYKAGVVEKESGNKDDYTERLPFFIVGNEKSATLGQSNFETAITKSEKAIALHSIRRKPELSPGKARSPKMKQYMQRREFNPFLKNAWLLMGRAQFQKGEFLEAASTFSYITRHYAAEPQVVAEARIWLARCYSQVDWFYDAEDALGKIRDSIPSRLRRELDASRADLLLRQNRLEEAAPLLANSARHAGSKVARARLYFLLAQVYTQLNRPNDAYKAYGRVISQSPAYETAFNARIRRTEVVATGTNAKKALRQLRSMARSSNNAEYLDQVYYAIGNIYLAQKDTTEAVRQYERGRAKAKRAGTDKAVLLLRLGEVYWDLGRYDRAQTCYAEAVGLISKKRADYDDIMRRSKVLDKLAPYTTAVQLQDSLLALSVASEADRNAAIDRVIADLKYREAQERRNKADSTAQALAGENSARGDNSGQSNATTTTTSTGAWYFYNPLAVSQGKQSFAKQWGQRKNEDNWRRSNRTVLASESDDYNYDEDDLAEAADSLAQDSLAAAPDSAQLDPHTREFYMAQIPFSPEAKEAAHAVIQDGLYNAGLIEKDQLEDFPLADRTLSRLIVNYPAFEKRADAIYQQFLLHSRAGNQERAEYYRQLLIAEFPQDVNARLIADPQFEYRARHARQLEDSLYTATYEAYRNRDNAAVARNFAESTEHYPTGLNRPKFIFVHALSRIGSEPADSIAAELRALVKQFPESDVSTMAGMIVRGIEEGRTFGSGSFDIGSLWNRRTATANAAVDEAGRARELTPDADGAFVVLIAYANDSVADSGKLLYDLAHFNFTGFIMRNFEMTTLHDRDISQIRLSGFNGFAEAYTYAQRLFEDRDLAAGLRSARIVVISAKNLELLGVNYGFDDYQKFYDQHFAPIRPERPAQLDMPETPVETHYEDEYTPEELDNINNGTTTNSDDGGTDDEDGWYTPN